MMIKPYHLKKMTRKKSTGSVQMQLEGGVETGSHFMPEAGLKLTI